MNKRLVKIKTWKQMEEEFGLDKNGGIDCENNFMKEMEEKLPKDRVINISTTKGWFVDDTTYSISEDMIEEEITPEDYPQYFI